MEKEMRIVQKIPSHYVLEDCVQIMIPYQNAITILNQDGILYHDTVGSNLLNINKYLKDNRRKQFPYSNIPIHYFRDKIYTNQILEFEKPYISISDNVVTERYVIKDNNEALMMKEVMKYKSYVKHMPYEEVLKIIEKKDTNDQVYYVNFDGTIPLYDNKLYFTEEEIYDQIKKMLKKNIEDFREAKQKNNDYLSEYLRKNPMFLNYFEKHIEKLDFSLIEFNCNITPLLIILRVNNGDITIQGVDVTFVKKDDFKVEVFEMLVNEYTLEQLKFLPNINLTKEIKIPLKINPGVARKDIKKAKQMIKTSKKTH